MDGNAHQIDWIRLEDHRVSAHRQLELAAKRVGIGELAHKLGEDPSTIVHQLHRDGSKRPSADLLVLVWLLDEDFRKGMAGLAGEVLSRPPDLTAEEALREATVKAQSQGYIDARELAALQTRVKRGSR